MRVTRHPYEVDGWGVGEVWVGDGEVVVAHDPPQPGARLGGTVPGADRRTQREKQRQTQRQTSPRGTPGVPTETLSQKSARDSDRFVPELLRLLHSYFAGQRVSFEEVPLDCDWGSPFQDALAAALRRVAWGEVVSYGELSKLAGRPRAARAAGTFCADNRFSLFLPCHRVVSVDGIGGYGSLGVEYKRRLLRLEGHASL